MPKLEKYEELADLVATRVATAAVIRMHNATLDTHTLVCRGPLLKSFNLVYENVYNTIMEEHTQPMRDEKPAAPPVKTKELTNLINRAAAALETPGALTPTEQRELIEDLVIMAKEVDSNAGDDNGEVSPPR